MSFSATGARRPLQSKQKKNPFLHRTPSSPLNNLPRRKPTQASARPSLKRAATENDAYDDYNDTSSERLDDTGIVTNIPPRGTPQDVVSLIKHIQSTAWNDIPERAPGMNSTRIADVLNFRRNLPPIVSLAHIHAVSKSATATERELARLIQSGVVRKINILGRGKGGAAVGEGVVLTEDWYRLVQENESLSAELKEKYIALLKEHPSSPVVDASAFAEQGSEVSDLVQAGFLTSTSALANTTELFSRPGAWSLGTASAIATSAPTGTLAVIGGPGAVLASGGGGAGLHPSSRGGTKNSMKTTTGELTFSLPATGSYLRILTEARTHFIELLKKSSPKYKEATRDILRERWDGGIPGNDSATRAKRARGEWLGVLPGKTKKWKTFYGMDFTWILEECLGSGAVECFNTGSVGLGVRAT